MLLISKLNMSVDEFERDHLWDGAEGEVAVNSQAKGSDSDDTLESQHWHRRSESFR